MPATALQQLQDGSAATLRLPGLAAIFVADEDARVRMAGEIVPYCGPGLSVAGSGMLDALAVANWAKETALVVVDIDGCADPLSDVTALHMGMPPEIVLLLIGSSNDVSLYRDLVSAGAADYLVKPLREQSFSKSLDRILALKAREASLIAAAQPQASGAMMVHPTASNQAQPRAVVFVGTRGGAGATTCAIAAAALLGEATKQQVLLMDLDLRFGSVMLALDLDPTSALREALDQPDRIDNLFIEQSAQRKSDRLFAIGAEELPTMELALKPNAVADVIREFQKRFSIVVVDVPRNDPAMQAQALAAATDIVMVCDLSLAGVRDAMRLGSLIHEIAPKAKTHLLASGSGDPKRQPVQVADVERSLKQKVLFQVPFDEKSIATAVSAGKPISEVAKASPIVKAMQELVKRIDALPERAKADGKQAKKPLFGFLRKS